LRLGIHTSISGSLEEAAVKAADLGANTFQIFSASPRMWRARPPDALQVRLLRAARDRFDLHPLVIHVNYLINLASLDPVIRSRSIAAFRGELDRALAIGAEFLVLHPGSHRGSSPEQGIEAFVEGLHDAARELPAGNLAVLLENTAGAGCHLGSRFEELATMRAMAAGVTDLPVGFCLDTCHLLAAGFDIATAPGLRTMLNHADATLGLDNVRVIHANDSKFPKGSNVDRHAHIGEGHIGREAFRRMLRHPSLCEKPFILETPVDDEGDDRRNLDTLKSLARRRVSKST
jgi:deoxyribonuclease-4